MREKNKVNHLEVGVVLKDYDETLSKLNRVEVVIDKINEKLEKANSLADELASRTDGDRMAALERPILDSINGAVLNGIDISKLPIKSQTVVRNDDGLKTVTIVLQWFAR